MSILGVSVKRGGAYEDMGPAPSWIKISGFYLPWNAPVVAIKALGVYDIGNGEAPSNIVPPIISGADNLPGTVLLCEDGTWAGNPTPALTHQWQRDGIDIPGAIVPLYVIQEADRGHAITCQERGTNLLGSLTVSSNSITPPDTAFSNEFTSEFH